MSDQHREAHQRAALVQQLLQQGDRDAALENAYAFEQLLNHHPELRRDDPDLQVAYESMRQVINELEDEHIVVPPPSSETRPPREEPYGGLMAEPEPEPPPRRGSAWALALLGLLAIVAVVSWPRLQTLREGLDLQSQLNVIHRDQLWSRGIEANISVRRTPHTLVFDLTDVPAGADADAVFRLLRQFAVRARQATFQRVVLAWRGNTRFLLDGNYFRKMGSESGQDAVYAAWTFPEHLRQPDGSAAYPHREGQWQEASQRQVQDFHDFHRRWYGQDLGLTP